MTNKKLEELQKEIGIIFSNFDLLKTALTHKSFNKEDNNEKLEFLGDRVIGLIISKYLLTNFSKDNEGILDKKFANLVNRFTCAKIAKNLKLKDYMFLGSSYIGLNRTNDKIISDCLEAVVGAIYLDQNYKEVEKFVLGNWKKYLDKSTVAVVDSKTKLQEYSLKKYKILPKYKFFNQSGPQHKPIFKVQVQIENSKKFTGVGASKKIAQQNAAKKLLLDLKI